MDKQVSIHQVSVRENFVTHFGESEAVRVEQAAYSHKNGIHDNPGSDPFKWAIAICIGYKCFTHFPGDHEFTTPYESIDGPGIKEWIQYECHLETHDGDVDFLALIAGRYNEFMPAQSPDQPVPDGAN